MPDLFELTGGLNPYLDDSYEDIDGDRFPNIFEYAHGSGINDPNSIPTPTFVVDGAATPSGNVFNSLKAALLQVNEGFQIIQIRNGTYSGTANVEAQFPSGFPVLLISEHGARTTVLDGGGTSRLLATTTDAIVDGLTLRNGMAGDGGAVSVGGGNVMAVNCVFSGNQAVQNGGAIYQSGGMLLVVHSTFLGNSAGGDGGSVYAQAGLAEVLKSVLWNSGSAAEVAFSGTASLSVTESIIRGGYAGTGNSGADPLLRADGHIVSTSPAIDSGGVLQTALFDMDGEVRPVGTTTDIGADEWVDTDDDDVPDWWEAAQFGSLSNQASGDTDGDGESNLSEYQSGSDPNDYYSRTNGYINAEITIISGDEQLGDPLSFAANPMIVEVTDGTSPLQNAPIYFSVSGSNDAKVSMTGSGTSVLPSVVVRTDSLGMARAYFRFPTSLKSETTIAVTQAPSTTTPDVTFSATTRDFPQSDLSLWLRADAGVITTSTSSVTTWQDQSGNGNDVVQPASGHQPLHVSDVVNGKPVVRFDGVNDFLQVASSTGWGVNSFSVIYYIKPFSLFDHNQHIRALGGWGQFYIHAAAARGGYAGTDLSARMTPSHILNGTFRVNEWQLFVFTYSDGIGRLYKNGTLVASKSMADPVAWTGFSLGVNFNQTIHGDVSELMVYSRALTPVERQAVELELYNKYGAYAPGVGWLLEFEEEFRNEIIRNNGVKKPRWSTSQNTNRC